MKHKTICFRFLCPVLQKCLSCTNSDNHLTHLLRLWLHWPGKIYKCFDQSRLEKYQFCINHNPNAFYFLGISPARIPCTIAVRFDLGISPHRILYKRVGRFRWSETHWDNQCTLLNFHLRFLDIDRANKMNNPFLTFQHHRESTRPVLRVCLHSHWGNPDKCSDQFVHCHEIDRPNNPNNLNYHFLIEIYQPNKENNLVGPVRLV